MVEATFAYNVILGRPMMSSFKTMTLTYHKKVKFLVGGWIGEVQEDQATLKKCYVEIIWADMKRTKVESDILEYQRRGSAKVQAVQDILSHNLEEVEQEEIHVVPDDLEKTTQVIADLPQELKQKLAINLAWNNKVFTWEEQKVRGVRSLRIIEHRLNILPKTRLIK